MKYQIIHWLAAVTVCILSLAIVSASTASSEIHQKDASKEELFLLTKLVGPLRGLAAEAEEIVELVERALKSKDLTEIAKRQSAWDMDYGWGGGRFGKRAQQKRYDMYSLAGRFGRDVQRAQAHQQQKH